MDENISNELNVIMKEMVQVHNVYDKNMAKIWGRLQSLKKRLKEHGL